LAEISPRIRELVEEVAQAHGAFLVDLFLRGGAQGRVLEVYVDTDPGITADGCAAISRGLSPRLDHENLIQGRYNLEVSSPGLDRPLKLLRQYRKNIGRNLKVRYHSEEEVRTMVGRLVEVQAGSIELEKEGKESVIIPLDRVQESKVEIEFGHTSR
jgi:ribosome maturation factor RimP